MAALLLLVLLAPVQRQWSERHGVGVWFPSSWTVVARDQGARAFVVEGPRLGPGTPRAVLWNGGPATDETLGEFARKLAERVRGLGHTITAEARKSIGPFPCIRVGTKFTSEGAKGRGRFTVALLGGSYYVLELSAAASHFPGATFDRIEQTLAVKWTKETIAGLELKVPRGWRREDDTLLGPLLGKGKSMLVLARDEEGLRGPPEAKPGPKVVFLGKPRETLVAHNEKRGLKMLVVFAEGRRAVAILPAGAWPDLYPVLEAILRTARLPDPE